MDYAKLIHEYGYYAVLFGTLLEGETILVMAAIAANQGYLHLPVLMPVAVAGAIIGDQFFYYMGRRHGNMLLTRFPSLSARAAKVESLIARHHAPVIVVLRFTYGLRIVGPMMVGMSAVSPLQFTLWNSLGSVLWAALIISAGYAFGDALQWLMGSIQKLEFLVLAVLAVMGATVWLIVRYRARRR
ncbi:DedA family protein [Sulfuriferula plumbiphila]|uniref:DedA family protein n=1 Tax=Sulfuriferula plumbiphila TaxID=171865 RepID=A0A512LBW7_9PROT|nr:DedA family protein [Sulfuriferula plumbiphila]BBP03937.1 DedA family protein [Sulfuriferula plumbiphila]GEP31641.1 DedA family protein [Sulfuriferula plumbiphila]